MYADEKERKWFWLSFQSGWFWSDDWIWWIRKSVIENIFGRNMVNENSVIIFSPGYVIQRGMQCAGDKLIESKTRQKVKLVSNPLWMQNFERLVIFLQICKYPNNQILWQDVFLSRFLFQFSPTFIWLLKFCLQWHWSLINCLILITNCTFIIMTL